MIHLITTLYNQSCGSYIAEIKTKKSLQNLTRWHHNSDQGIKLITVPREVLDCTRTDRYLQI